MTNGFLFYFFNDFWSLAVFFFIIITVLELFLLAMLFHHFFPFILICCCFWCRLADCERTRLLFVLVWFGKPAPMCGCLRSWWEPGRMHLKLHFVQKWNKKTERNSAREILSSIPRAIFWVDGHHGKSKVGEGCSHEKWRLILMSLLPMTVTWEACFLVSSSILGPVSMVLNDGWIY